MPQMGPSLIFVSHIVLDVTLLNVPIITTYALYWT